MVLERNGDVGDVDEDVGGGCDVDVGGAVFQSILVPVCSDLAKRVEEEATGGEDGEGALEPEAQFSLDSLDIIKVLKNNERHDLKM